MKLTTTNVDKLRFPTGASTKTGKPITHVIVWDATLSGFGVRLSANSDRKTYVLQQRIKGSNRERNISLGRHADPVLQPDGSLRPYPFGADDARVRALRLVAQLRDGIDPVEAEQRKEKERADQEQRQRALSTTLRQVMEDYIVNKRTKHGPLRAATKADLRRTVEKNLTTWLDEPVAAITRDQCLAKFTEVTERAPQVANSMAVYLRALLNHAREMHATDDGDYPILAVNPVSRMFKLRKRNAEKVSSTRIPLDKVGACWNWLRKRATEARTENERTAADWVSFIMLTGCRRSESASLKWSDVDLASKTITLRSDVVKNHTQVILPMSTLMHDLLSARKNPPPLPDKVLRRRTERRRENYVFASNGKKTPHITDAKAVINGLTAIAGTHAHLHALRRTFDSIAMECKIDGDIRRMLLNHINGDVHARHYSNDARAMEGAVESIAKWIGDAALVAEAQASGANVVPFRGKPAQA